MAESDQYEIERIVDHVSFLDAFKDVHKFNGDKYTAIFAKERFNKKKKVQTVSKYFFQIKWLNYEVESCTWEPESEIPVGVFLHEYKLLNNLTIPKAVQKLSLNFELRGRDYRDPVIISETYEKQPRSKNRVDSKLNEMPFFLYDQSYNGSYGMVPVTKFTQKPHHDYVILNRGNTNLVMKQKLLVDKANPDETDRYIKDYNLNNRSFLQIILKDHNILKMHDCYTTFDKELKTLTINSIYEWSDQSLRQKLRGQAVNWMQVSRDILKALQFIHPHGAHQSVSLDSIYFDGRHNYKLSHFDNFVFNRSIPVDDVKSCGVEYAPRKLGLQDPFNNILDIYALAIVNLQCLKGVRFQSEYKFVREIENDIEKGLRTLDSEQERHYIKLMLRARLHTHNGLETYRFTPDSFLNQLEMLQSKKMKSVECYYLHSWLSTPIKEHIFYNGKDTVVEVINRLLSLHHEGSPESKYCMVYSENPGPAQAVYRFNETENFESIVNKEVKVKNLRLTILPMLKPTEKPISVYSQKNETEGPFKYMIIYEQELEGLPIMFETTETNVREIVLQAKYACVREEYRKARVQLFKRPPHPEIKGGYPFYSQNQFLLNIEATVKNRFEDARDIEGKLGCEFLKWSDVAGVKGRRDEEKVVGKKRSNEFVLLPEVGNVENNKRQRSTNKVELPTDDIS